MEKGHIDGIAVTALYLDNRATLETLLTPYIKQAGTLIQANASMIATIAVLLAFITFATLKMLKKA